MSEQMIARRIALAGPIVLTGFWLAVTAGLVAVAWLSVTNGQPIIEVFGYAVPVLFICAICGWSWAIFTLSARARPNQLRRGLKQGIYLAPPLITVTALLAGLPTHNSPAGFCIMVTLLAGLWLAAQALEEATSDGVPAGIRRTLVTMFLMYFSIIGVWVLRSKIEKVAT